MAERVPWDDPLSEAMKRASISELELSLKRIGVEPTKSPRMISGEELEQAKSEGGAAFARMSALVNLMAGAAYWSRLDLIEWLASDYDIPLAAVYGAFLAAAAKGSLASGRRLLDFYEVAPDGLSELFSVSMINDRARFASWLADRFNIARELNNPAYVAQLTGGLLAKGNLSGARWLEDKFGVVRKLNDPELVVAVLERALEAENLGAADWLAQTLGPMFPMLRGSRYVSEMLLRFSSSDRPTPVKWAVEKLRLSEEDVFVRLHLTVAIWLMQNFGRREVAAYLAAHYNIKIPPMTADFDPNKNEEQRKRFAEYRQLWKIS